MTITTSHFGFTGRWARHWPNILCLRVVIVLGAYDKKCAWDHNSSCQVGQSVLSNYPNQDLLANQRQFTGQFPDHITLDVVYWSGKEKLCCPWDIILEKEFRVTKEWNLSRVSALSRDNYRPRKISSVGYNVPGEGHGDVLVTDQTISIIPEVVLGVHTKMGT